MTSNRDYASAARFRAELRRFLRRSEDCSRRHGLTPRQHLLLLMIAGTDRATSTVSELVQRAEEAGLVSRQPSTSDGRVVDLTLTPEGEVRLAAVHDELGPERHQLRQMVEQLED